MQRMYFTYERPDFDRNDPKEVLRVIEEAYRNGLECARSGAGRAADYIPELAKADPGEFGLCVWGADGEVAAFGETGSLISGRSILPTSPEKTTVVFPPFSSAVISMLAEPRRCPASMKRTEIPFAGETVFS